MKFQPIAIGLILFVCGLVLIASLADLHCTLIHPGGATFVLACRASRLEARR